MVLQERIELSASPLPRGCSTTELLQRTVGERATAAAGAQVPMNAHGARACLINRFARAWPRRLRTSHGHLFSPDGPKRQYAQVTAHETIVSMLTKNRAPLASGRLVRRFRILRRGASLAFAREITRFRENEIALIAIAALAGFAIGAIVAIIDGAVVWLHHLIFGVPLDAHLSAGPEIPPLVRVLAPAAGGLLVGLIALAIRRFRPREIVDAIEANALYGGRMSLRDSINLALLTIVAVGFGGSAGLEAAYTQVGSGFASKIGQNIRLRRQDLRLLVGCGSAAAIAAAFDSPLTGAFYAFELVIGSYTLQWLAPVASAALCGNLAIHAISNGRPLFILPPAMTVASHDYLLFLLLGFGAAAIAIATMRAVTVIENALRQYKAPRILRPVLGGTGVGLIALFFPEVLGADTGPSRISLREAPGFERWRPCSSPRSRLRRSPWVGNARRPFQFGSFPRGDLRRSGCGGSAGPVPRAVGQSSRIRIGRDGRGRGRRGWRSADDDAPRP